MDDNFTGVDAGNSVGAEHGSVPIGVGYTLDGT